jgi:glycine/D-amino acid oxidase-like deaminating enzyme
LQRVCIRPEQHQFIRNLSPSHEEGLDDLPLDADFSIFEERCGRFWRHGFQPSSHCVECAWAAHYQFNTADHNGLVGQIGPDHFFVAPGFSGHGLMHSPGVGRGMARLLTYGEYRSLDPRRYRPNDYTPAS